MKLHRYWLPLGLILTLGVLLGVLFFSIWEQIPVPVERVVWSQQAQWIGAKQPTYRFYARHTFDLPGQVKAGWLRISADNDFRIYVNGKQIARERNVYNSSHGLAPGMRSNNQSFNDSNRYDAPTAVNYLVASSHDWKLSTYIDLSLYLRPGKNVIALSIQKAQTNPRVVVEGAVYPVANTTPIAIATGNSWRVSNLSENQRSLQWQDVDFVDVNWSEAETLGSVKEATYSRLSKNLFAPLQGTWLTGTQNTKGQVSLQGVWQLPSTQSRAYIRFAGKGQYSLLLNGNLVNHYRTENGDKLHLLEVTKLLHTGKNIFAVSLASPLDAVNPRGEVSFFLDGWVESSSQIVETFSTDNTWTSVNQPVALLGLPNPQQFQRNIEGNAYLLNYPNYLWHLISWQLVGVVNTLVYALILGLWFRCALKQQVSLWDSLSVGTAILTPATLLLTGVALLKHRYAEAEIGLLFAQPNSNYLILLAFIGAVLVTLLLSFINCRFGLLSRSSLWFCLGIVGFISLMAISANVFMVLLIAGVIITGVYISNISRLRVLIATFPWSKVYQSSGQWLLLIVIIGVGLGLRVYNLDFMDLDSDENTSYDATRGILRIGAPIATSGIWYTRGPFYHYLLAIWLRIIGDSIANARFLSALWGTATLVLVYFFARKVTGFSWIALLITAVLAIDPWHLWYSRYIRFYPILQFMTIVCFWSFLNGFIEKAGRRYQLCFFIALTLSLLSQEINLTLLPVFFLGFLYFYRPFNFVNDWQIVLGSTMTLIIFIYNLGFAVIRLLTPLPALSDATASYLRLHFSNVTNLFAIFFVGPDRTHTLYSLFFFAGFIYFLHRRNETILFLFSSVFINLALVTLLTYDLAERYVYGIYPLYILLSIYSSICIVKTLGEKTQIILHNILPMKTIALSCVILLLSANVEFVRVLDGYQEALVRRNNQLFEYIKTHRQAGDVVISPMSSFAAISLGQLDYYLFNPLKRENFDATYWHNGRLIDRWGGGVVVNNTDQMNRILENNKRVWIHVDDVRQERVTSELRHYIEILGKPVYETFGAGLRLWEASDLPINIPNSGKDLGAY
jgi:4-amino-4-deoxy-L-arabinose transferase-like glycosyltransferase